MQTSVHTCVNTHSPWHRPGGNTSELVPVGTWSSGRSALGQGCGLELGLRLGQLVSTSRKVNAESLLVFSVKQYFTNAVCAFLTNTVSALSVWVEWVC